MQNIVHFEWNKVNIDWMNRSSTFQKSGTSIVLFLHKPPHLHASISKINFDEINTGREGF